MTIFSNERAGGVNDIAIQGDVKEVPAGDLFADMGRTGLKRSVGTIDEEFLPALRGRKAVGVFKEMSLNDATVGSLLFALENLLRQVDWTVVGDDNSPEQSQAVQFLEECMDDMSHSWSDLISEILSMFVYGWSWHEIVYKKRVGPWEKDPSKRSKHTDGKIGWRKMPIRSQETLHRWIFDPDGGVQGMEQLAPPEYQMRTMSIQKCLLFRTSRHKDNPEGRSILRNAYRPWYFKKRLEEFEAIGVERDLAGLPMARVPADIMKANASPDKKAMYQAFKKLVSNVRRDEHDGLVIPSETDDKGNPVYDFELMTSGGTRTFNTSEIIGRAALDILSVVLGDFIKLGHEGSGSYAMHVDKTGIFRAALNTFAKQIADVFNRHAIPRLFAANNWKLDRLPRIEPSNVDPPNLAELGQFMTSMAGLGMTFFPDPDLEKYLRETAHLPALSEEAEEMRRQMADQNNAMMYMQSSMDAQGAAQQHEMVEGGMTPDQAMMASQTPTPEMQAQDPATQMQQQQGAMDLESKQQQMQLDAAGRQQDLEHKDQAHQQTMAQTAQAGDLQRQQGEADLTLKMKQMQMELDQMKARMGLERQGQQADLKNKQEASRVDLDGKKKAQVFDLDAKRKQAQAAKTGARDSGTRSDASKRPVRRGVSKSIAPNPFARR